MFQLFFKKKKKDIHLTYNKKNLRIFPIDCKQLDLSNHSS